MTRTPTHSAVWQSLREHAKRIAPQSSRQLCRATPRCLAPLEAAGLWVDFSRQRVDAAVLEALLQLGEGMGIVASRDAMFRGARINATEGRAALHAALRAPDSGPDLGFPRQVVEDVLAMRHRLAAFCEAFEASEVRGAAGRPLTSVVNIGIGGSDLGPRMVCQALAPFSRPGVEVHFVSNVDGHDLASTLHRCDPATTLFIVASKTFTTQETMINAETARQWLVAGTGDPTAVARQFLALSTNQAAVSAFGIPAERTFGFWDWVGGRYSLWSSIGLSIALAVGYRNFERLLAGARAMDRHFVTAPMDRNLPMLMALLGVWNRNFLSLGTLAVLPYDQRLARLPAFLQQLEMESNGKTVRHDGRAVDTATVPVVWGEPGTNGQHAFYQYLHQGSEPTAIDMMAVAQPASVESLVGVAHDWRARFAREHHTALLANCLAQAEAFVNGQTTSEAVAAMRGAGLSASEAARLAPHRTFPGNRPLTMIVCDALTPESLGALVALYEHKVFCQGVIWGVNAFDQFGVELGKGIAKRLEPAIRGDCEPDAVTGDPSTRALLERLAGILRGRGED